MMTAVIMTTGVMEQNQLWIADLGIESAADLKSKIRNLHSEILLTPVLHHSNLNLKTQTEKEDDHNF